MLVSWPVKFFGKLGRRCPELIIMLIFGSWAHCEMGPVVLRLLPEVRAEIVEVQPSVLEGVLAQLDVVLKVFQVYN